MTNAQRQKLFRDRHPERVKIAQRLYESRRPKTEKRREYSAQYRMKIRAAIIAFLGSSCVKCGFTDVRALQVDHINGGGHREVSSIGQYHVMKKVLNGDDGYQLLCANCNWIKRVENQELKRI